MKMQAIPISPGSLGDKLSFVTAPCTVTMYPIAEQSAVIRLL